MWLGELGDTVWPSSRGHFIQGPGGKTSAPVLYCSCAQCVFVLRLEIFCWGWPSRRERWWGCVLTAEWDRMGCSMTGWTGVFTAPYAPFYIMLLNIWAGLVTHAAFVSLQLIFSLASKSNNLSLHCGLGKFGVFHFGVRSAQIETEVKSQSWSLSFPYYGLYLSHSLYGSPLK